jgi:hypothetical protein
VRGQCLFPKTDVESPCLADCFAIIHLLGGSFLLYRVLFRPLFLAAFRVTFHFFQRTYPGIWVRDLPHIGRRSRNKPPVNFIP